MVCYLLMVSLSVIPLEDEYRDGKVMGETCIPEGTYDVKPRTEGGFHNRYTAKYGDFHKGMLHVQDVPNFEFILIHTGNTDEHTAGRLLLGETSQDLDSKDGLSVHLLWRIKKHIQRY